MEYLGAATAGDIFTPCSASSSHSVTSFLTSTSIRSGCWGVFTLPEYELGEIRSSIQLSKILNCFL